MNKTMEILPPIKIKIADVKGKGRGVISTAIIKRDEIIEYCPVIFVSKKEADFIENQSATLKFYYLYQPETEKYCIMFGYGSIYNHSKIPNAEIDYDTGVLKNYIYFRALKDIKAGEEIVFDYQFNDGKEDFLKQ